ncbi:DUF4258 domain-containing protein [Rhodococcus cercidiphylli]|uniref:DUF4258 domain-containing protein n=1 Tax=Rhodococcus cercidiphylli TaxID=489916 RepID=UPI00374E5164
MTGHAEARMRSRSITREDIESALGNVSGTRPGRNGSVVHLGTTGSGKMLEVASVITTDANGNHAHVIKTAFWK